MNRFARYSHTRRALGVLAALAGFAAAAYVGVAAAKTFTVQAARNAVVMNQSGVRTSESIAVTSAGRAAYTLSGDSKTHPKCVKANGCLTFWPPVTVSSSRKLTKGPGVSGRLGTWRRDGFLQVTLNGHPLYRFSLDRQRDQATGEGIVSFGGTWHVVRVGSSTGGSTSAPAGTTTSTTAPTTSTTSTTSTTPTTSTSSTTPTTTTTTTTTCLYPPCY